MSFFFAFLGLSSGLFIGGGENIWEIGISTFMAVLFLFLSIKRKRWISFSLFLFAGVLFSLLRRIPPLGEGEYFGLVIESKDNYFLFLSRWGRYYVYQKSNPYEVGDFLSIKGIAEPYSFVTYESRFDFGSYLHKKGVGAEISPFEIVSRFKMPIRIRNLEDKFLSFFSEEARGLLSSLLFNRKDMDNPAIKQASSLSLIAIYSSSGLIYSLILRSIGRILEPQIAKKQIDVICFIVASLLLPFSIGKIGIVRVFLSRLIKIIDEFALHRNLSGLSITSLSGVTILFFDPYQIFQTSFLLGFGISIIMYFSSSLIQRAKPWRRKALSTILIQILILPSQISGSGGVHIFLPLFSLISIPLLFPFVLLGWLSYITLPFVSLLNGYGTFLCKVLSVFGRIDIFISLPSLHAAWAFLYYLCFILALYFKEIGFNKISLALPSFLFGVYSMTLLPVSSIFTDQVSFINVGQGDCILIRDNFKTVMIDTGGNLSFDMAEEVLIPYLRKERIYKIDCLIASHGDFDHIGAKDSLMKHYSVSSFIDSPSSFPLDIGNIHLENYNIYEAKEENESSLVIGLSFMDKKWLFMGDAPTGIERKIIEDYPDIDCDILKVGHHGSDTSTCKEFIEKITPEEAIISVGANNKYGHPKDSVIKLLSSKRIKIRRTDKEGTISYRKISFWWV